MKKFTKYAMLMAVAIIAALQLGACKGSDEAAINDIVHELKEDKDFKSVEYDGKNIVAVVEVNDPSVEAAIKQNGAEQLAGMMEQVILQQMKSSGTLKGTDKAQVQALVNKNCGLQFKLQAGSEKLEFTIPAEEFAKLLEE